jgi:transcriptional regulator with XRE-family HTH domain
MSQHETPHLRSYAAELRGKLSRHGISLGGLSRASGISRRQLARWMNTPAEPSWRSIQRIEAALESVIAPESPIAEYRSDSSSGAPCSHFAFVELTNGPGDGQTGFVEVELPRGLQPFVRNINGNFVELTYTKVGDSIPLVVAFKDCDEWVEGDYDSLKRAFQGTRPVKYAWVRNDVDA